MAKKRNRNRGRQRAKQNLWVQFRAKSLVQSVEDDAGQEEYRVKQKEYLQGLADLEKDLLSRTVFVGSVKPLGERQNLDGLKRFMQQYGRVEICIAKKLRNRDRFPNGKVRFYDPKDADKIFGMPLEEARKKNRQERVLCLSVGYRGNITIRPSPKYRGMMQDELTENKLIKVNTTDLSFGHWFPEGKDECFNISGLEDICKADKSRWVEEKGTSASPSISFDFTRSVVELDFTSNEVTPLHVLRRARLQGSTVPKLGERIFASFRFKELAYPMELCRCNRGRYYLVFSLKYPPRLSSEWTDQAGWEDRARLTTIAGLGEQEFGGCFGYKLCLSETEINRLLLNRNALEKLHDFGVLRQGVDSLQQAEGFQLQHVNLGQREELNNKMAQMGNTTVGLLLRSILDTQTCCWLDMRNDRAIVENDTLQDLCTLVRLGSRETVENVLTQMKDTHGKTRYPAKMFHALSGAAEEEKEETRPRSIPAFCVNLPRLLLTPTRLCLTGFQLEVSNRLVRKFIHEEGFSPRSFVRVTIGDENGDKLFSDDLKAESLLDEGAVAARIEHLLLNGAIINGATYRFLAYSSSQLKELSVWMVCPEHGWSIESMRASMGDFSECKTPSKYAARIGQCFSTTVETSSPAGDGDDVAARRLRVKDDLDDIETFNSTTGEMMQHSDGVGLIKRDVLSALVSTFPFGPKNPRHVSAIQIRYGGAKGVLVGWDFDAVRDQRCQGYDVCLRPSMVKFSAPYDRLEIVSIGSHVPYYLNRNVILLLSHHGISNQTILGMQSEMLQKLNRMLTDRSFAAAFIPSLSGPDSTTVSTLGQMLAAGLEPSQDPFLFGCLHATRAHHLTGLRKKARIHVEKGAVLIGCIDETGLVPEGCIFAQVQTQQPEAEKNDDDSDGFEPIVGPVFVTKHPVMHVGDLRLLQGIDCPQLRGHRNCVLFSQHGERPEADKMAGSDLDGDQFALTWDERLLPRRTSSPMDYSPPIVEACTDDDISDRSLIKHFIDHARSDNLGRIAMLWLDHAVDKKDAGCQECLQLAELHSIAVDFPKSGIPATIPKELTLPSNHPRAHWREKKGGISFHCDSIVGQLYDQIISEIRSATRSSKPHEAMAGRYCAKNGQILIVGDALKIMLAKEQIYNALLPKILGWSSDVGLDVILQEFANEQRHQYESQINGLMNQYRIKCEGEVVTGCILKYHKLFKRKRHDVSEEVRRQFRIIRSEFRLEFFRAVFHMVNNNLDFFYEDDTNDEAPMLDDFSQTEIGWIQSAATTSTSCHEGDAKMQAACGYSRRLAAAYYISTYSPQMHDSESQSTLYSFPWVVAADVIACAAADAA